MDELEEKIQKMEALFAKKGNYWREEELTSILSELDRLSADMNAMVVKYPPAKEILEARKLAERIFALFRENKKPCKDTESGFTTHEEGQTCRSYEATQFLQIIETYLKKIERLDCWAGVVGYMNNESCKARMENE